MIQSGDTWTDKQRERGRHSDRERKGKRGVKMFEVNENKRGLVTSNCINRLRLRVRYEVIQKNF